MKHPSFLQLDRFALGSGDAEISEHLRDCQPCNAHFGRSSLPVAMPAWARELPKPRRWRWTLLALSLSTAAAVAVVVVPRGHSEVTAKGNPSVAVYLRRGEHVSLWDGVQPLQPGDAVQLKVQTFGYSRITVGSIESGKVQTLYEGVAQADAATLLPQAFTLDGANHDEALLVVFSREPLSQDELRAARESQRRDSRQWTTVLELTKRIDR